MYNNELIAKLMLMWIDSLVLMPVSMGVSFALNRLPHMLFDDMAVYLRRENKMSFI